MEKTISSEIKESYKEILKEISGEVYLKLADSKIKNYFKNFGDLYTADADSMVLNSSIVGFGKSKGVVLKDFQKKLETEMDYYIKVWQAIQPIQIEVPDDSFVNKLRFVLSKLKDYYVLQEWLNFQMGYMPGKILFSEVLDKYYGINSDGRWLSNIEIARQHGCKQQYVDHVRLKNMGLGKLLAESSEKLKINFQGTSFIEDLAAKKYTSRIRTAIDPDGLLDNELLNRYTDIFDFSISKYHIYSKEDDLIERYFLTAKKEIGEFRENLRILINSSKDKVLSRTENEIINDVKNAWQKSKFVINEEALKGLIRGSEIFQQDDDSEDTKYFTKWILLSENKVRVARILLDEGRPIFRKEIFKLYNHLCNLNDITGLDDETQVRTNHANVLSKGNNLWIYGDSNSNKENLDIFKAIEELAIAFAGPFVLQNLYNQIYVQFPNYNIDTIKTYVTSRANCRSVIQNTEFDYIHESLLPIFPNIKVAQKQNSGIGYRIIQEILKTLRAENRKFSINEIEESVIKIIQTDSGETFRKYHFIHLLKKLVEKGFVIELNDEYLSNIEELDENEILSIGKSVEPAYRIAIKDRTVQILKARNNTPIKLTELWDMVADLYPKDIVVNNWYKIFHDQELFTKSNDGSRVYLSLKLTELPKPVEPKVEALPFAIGLSKEEFEELRLLLGKPFESDKLFKQIKELLSNTYKMSEENIEKGINVFKCMYNEYMENNRVNWMYSMLKDIHSVWNLKTDIYDRRDCVNKLVSSYETYVKKLIWNKDEFIGISKLLEENRNLKSLKYYKRNYKNLNYWELDILKKDMSFALTRLIEMADALRHNQDEEKVQVNYNDGNLMKNIENFIALYIYTGALV